MSAKLCWSSWVSLDLDLKNLHIGFYCSTSTTKLAATLWIQHDKCVPSGVQILEVVRGLLRWASCRLMQSFLQSVSRGALWPWPLSRVCLHLVSLRWLIFRWTSTWTNLLIGSLIWFSAYHDSYVQNPRGKVERNKLFLTALCCDGELVKCFPQDEYLFGGIDGGMLCTRYSHGRLRSHSGWEAQILRQSHTVVFHMLKVV